MSMRRLFEAFHSAGKELFLVGGAVRDLAMGASEVELDDLDFTTNGLPHETLAILQGNGFRTYEMGIEFGTVGAVLSGPPSGGFPKDVQVTTYRSGEYYRRGSRHPTVSFGDTLAQDLRRRDFSINSIAMDLDGNWVDPYGGLRDLEAGVLRVVGDAHETLAEDPLRILRVGRFMAKLGFVPTPELEQAAYDCATHILDISRERWHQELDKLLVAPHVAAAMDFLARVRLLNVIMPELTALIDLHERTPVGSTPVDWWAQTLALIEAAGRDRTVSWAAMMVHTGRPWVRSFDGLQPPPPGPVAAGLGSSRHPLAASAGVGVNYDRHAKMAGEFARGLARRFHMDHKLATAIEFTVLNQELALSYGPAMTDADVRHLYRRMEGYHAELIGLATALRKVQSQERGASAEELVELQARIADLDARGQLVPRLPGGLGNLLMAELAVPRGPMLGELLAWLTEEIMAGGVGSALDPEVYLNYLMERSPPVLERARQVVGPSRRGGPGTGRH